jgi:hypothetical protein
MDVLKDDRTAGSAALALATIGPKARGRIPALIELLDRLSRNHSPTDAQKRVLADVITAVGLFGSDAKTAVPILLRIVEAEGGSFGLNYDAIRALGRIGTAAREAIPALEKLIESDYPLDELASEALDAIQAQH